MNTIFIAINFNCIETMRCTYVREKKLDLLYS